MVLLKKIKMTLLFLIVTITSPSLCLNKGSELGVGMVGFSAIVAGVIAGAKLSNLIEMQINKYFFPELYVLKSLKNSINESSKSAYYEIGKKYNGYIDNYLIEKGIIKKQSWQDYLKQIKSTVSIIPFKDQEKLLPLINNYEAKYNDYHAFNSLEKSNYYISSSQKETIETNISESIQEKDKKLHAIKMNDTFLHSSLTEEEKNLWPFTRYEKNYKEEYKRYSILSPQDKADLIIDNQKLVYRIELLHQLDKESKKLVAATQEIEDSLPVPKWVKYIPHINGTVMTGLGSALLYTLIRKNFFTTD